MLKLGAVHKSLYGSRGQARTLWRRLLRRFYSLRPMDFVVPDNLLLLTSHNYEKTLFELQMERHRVPSDRYKVIEFGEVDSAEWSHLLRWKKMLEYLEGEDCKTKEYILFCDATDVLFVDSPSNILINFLKHFDCDLLYNATTFKNHTRWDKYSEEDLEHHARKRREFGQNCHLNAGLFIGRKDFVIRVYKDMLSYEFDSKGKRDEKLWGEHPEYPYGCTYDQQILRFLEHKYYPQLQIDGHQKLLARCHKIGKLWRAGKISADVFV
jgi:hypothetical protein